MNRDQMKLLNHISALRTRLDKERTAGKQIGMVPTMGALHEGHLSLVRRCIAENEICVVTIFVNPTQFNDAKDFEAYPQTIKEDVTFLEALGCDYLFVPTVEEIYPSPDERVFELGPVSEVMEGFYRPGHFNGVAQIVSLLFTSFEPHTAYFGEKDFQQVAVIRAMVKQLQLPVKIVTCPTIREEDGLAMSSRNRRLTADQRQIAPIIAATLKESRTFVGEKEVQEVIDFVVKKLNESPFLQVEYFNIVDDESLQSINDWNEATGVVGCIAVFCGEIRLIDNVRYV